MSLIPFPGSFFNFKLSLFRHFGFVKCLPFSRKGSHFFSFGQLTAKNYGRAFTLVTDDASSTFNSSISQTQPETDSCPSGAITIFHSLLIIQIHSNNHSDLQEGIVGHIIIIYSNYVQCQQCIKSYLLTKVGKNEALLVSLRIQSQVLKSQGI